MAEGGVVREQVDARLRELARRAGLGEIPAAVLWAAAIAFGVAIVWGLWHWWPVDAARGRGSAGGSDVLTRGAASQGRASGAESTRTGTAARADASATVCVHVVGAIHHPGLYRLASGSRVADAVDAAGGVTAHGAPEGVNLARVLADGEQIAVPTSDELKHGAAGDAAGPASGVAGAGSGERVNINTADAAVLDKLPGIGPSTAARIVADRAANGPFATPDDLGRVSGIGPKKLAQLKPGICVN